MPVTPHIEKHFTATATVRDIVIGMADGLPSWVGMVPVSWLPERSSSVRLVRLPSWEGMFP